MNPSNQPEPKPHNMDEINLCKGCGTMKHLNADGLCGRCVKQNDSPNVNKTRNSVYNGSADVNEKPDAQAEAGRPALLPKPEPGLATTIKSQLSRAYYNGLDKKGWSLYEEKDAVDIILADTKADKAAAIDVAIEGARKHTYTLPQVHEAIRRQLGTKTHPEMVAIIIEDVTEELARLQPPTAGEGESV